MRERGHTPRGADPTHHDTERRPFGRDVGGFACAQISAECLVGAIDVAAGDHGVRQMSARRQAGLRLHGGEQLRARQSELFQARAYLAHSFPAAFALSAQYATQWSGGRIYPQPQHMDGLGAPGGGDFNTGDEPQPKPICTMFRLLKARHRIVVGERQ